MNSPKSSFILFAFMMVMYGASFAQGDVIVRNNYVGLSYEYSFFNDATDPWYFLTLSAKLGNERNIFLPHIQSGSRFNTNGLLAGMDYYHILKNKDYIMLTGSVATMPVFPGYTLGAEYFNPFGKGYEMSMGAKYLEFQNNIQILLFTGSLSKYYGKFLSIARPFLAVQDFNGRVSNLSFAFQQRYYRTDKQYLSLNASAGYDPNVQLFGDINQVVSPDARLFTIGLVSTHALHKRWEGIFQAEYTNWQFVTVQRNQYMANVKLRYLIQ